MKSVRAALVFVLSLAYLSYVFQLSTGKFWHSGLGDWIDPYFINALLEHWYSSILRLADPSSPQMFFPASKTLGYSHGLILYAVFYLPLRVFLHPFQAYNATLFLVLETGIVCLYLLLRNIGLTFIESLLLAAFFCTSENVVHVAMGVWAQRASVFLIPPILVVVLISRRMRASAARLMMAGLSGLLAGLMYVQDFHTAHFALLFALVFWTAATAENPWRHARPFWKTQPRWTQVVLAIAAVGALWTCYVWMYGGVDFRVLGVRVASRDWRRPGLLAVVALIVLLISSGEIRAKVRGMAPDPWLVAFGLGALVGATVFLWIYLDAYLAHPHFPEQEIRNALLASDPSQWRTPQDLAMVFAAFDTLRSFKLALVLGLMMWMPWPIAGRNTRRYGVWLLTVSVIVLLIPLRLDGFSVWTAFLERLPGFGVIRDPKRIIYLYELALVLTLAPLMTRLVNRAYRISLVLLMLALILTDWNREVFGYARPIAVYERWVTAPIAIDPSCQSFAVKAASKEYTSRSDNMWSLYSLDAFFVSLNHSIPTLNGYSAWVPESWELHNPQDSEYARRVRRWIGEHKLDGVCEFDIDARTMKPRSR